MCDINQELFFAPNTSTATLPPTAAVYAANSNPRALPRAEKGWCTKMMEEISSITSIFESELKCSICLFLLDDPALLPCNHRFCHACIQQSLTADPRCPTCRVQARPRSIVRDGRAANMVLAYESIQTNDGAVVSHGEMRRNLWRKRKRPAADGAGAAAGAAEDGAEGRAEAVTGGAEAAAAAARKHRKSNAVSPPTKPADGGGGEHGESAEDAARAQAELEAEVDGAETESASGSEFTATKGESEPQESVPVEPEPEPEQQQEEAAEIAMPGSAEVVINESEIVRSTQATPAAAAASSSDDSSDDEPIGQASEKAVLRATAAAGATAAEAQSSSSGGAGKPEPPAATASDQSGSASSSAEDPFSYRLEPQKAQARPVAPHSLLKLAAGGSSGATAAAGGGRGLGRATASAAQHKPRLQLKSEPARAAREAESAAESAAAASYEPGSGSGSESEPEPAPEPRRLRDRGGASRSRSTPKAAPKPAAAKARPRASAAKAARVTVDRIVLDLGLEDWQRDAVTGFAAQHGKVPVSTDFSGAAKHKRREPSHYIIATDDNNTEQPIGTRSVDYCEAVARGCWVVSFAWITECMEGKGKTSWVSPEKYEVRADDAGVVGIAAHSRTQAMTQRCNLFHGWSFYLGAFNQSPKPKPAARGSRGRSSSRGSSKPERSEFEQQITRIFQQQGGTLLQRPPVSVKEGGIAGDLEQWRDEETAKSVVLLPQDATGDVVSDTVSRCAGAGSFLMPRWILDCVAEQRIVPTEEYSMQHRH